MSKIPYQDIDVNMRPIIKELNDKGWTTAYCCEGHYMEQYNGYWCTYLAFVVDIPKSLQPKIDGYPLRPRDKIRSKMTYQYSDYCDGAEDSIFYWFGDKHKRMSREDKDREHDRLLEEIMKWAKGMPNR